jgi:primosomal protein N' (replication factor Y)
LRQVLTADVAVPIPIDKALTYLVPRELEDSIAVGTRVVVPVRSKVVTGIVCDISPHRGHVKGLRSIKDMADDRAVVSPELMKLARWISEYYVAPLGEVLAAVSPPQPALRRVYSLKGAPGGLEIEMMRASHPEQASIVEALSTGRPLTLATIRRKTGIRDIASHLDALEKQGYLSCEVVAGKRRKPKERQAGADAAVGAGSDEIPTLTPAQQAAFNGIKAALDEGRSEAFLLFGVTGSGKTEVYLRSIEHTLKAGKRAIYLVPEIGLTPQIMDRVRRRFGNRCAVLHSRLSSGERYATWNAIRSGRIDVAVGARSAVFAPLENLGVIVVDEEHDTSYKQQESPRYNAREVAITRALEAGAVAILGSATPTVETYHSAATGAFRLYELPERISGGSLPAVEIIDMRSAEHDSPLSKEVEVSIADSVGRDEQILLFLNRRGFSNYVQCHECGLVPRCRNCQVSLTYHLGGRVLRCHYCGYVERGWEVCPKCGGSNVEFVGSGTQRVEEYISEHFPDVPCTRFDRDSTRRKGSAESVLNDFSGGLIRFLVGTQMVAKGHDFRRVGLVVVVNADTSMNLPDFRSGERTFQILTQVAGRAGRGDIPGRVLVQTFNPEHHSLSYVANHDFKGFFREEVVMREELGYPPFTRLIRVVAESRKQASAQESAQAFADTALRLRRSFKGRLDIMGPSRAPLSRIRNTHRWHLLIKGEKQTSLSPFVRKCLEELEASGLADAARFSVDVDPQVMM